MRFYFIIKLKLKINKTYSSLVSLIPNTLYFYKPNIALNCTA